jgi:O-antigen ligase
VSVWPSQPERLPPHRPFATRASIAFRARPLNRRFALWCGCLICILVAQGAAIAHSYLWAAPLLCLLLVAVAVDLPMVPFLGLIMFVRVLTDDLSSATSRHSAALNISGLIAVLFILVAVGLLLRRRQGLRPMLLIGLWLILWTAIAASTHGWSTLTIREGVREASIVALAAIAFNARGALTLSVVTRLIQVVGLASAFLALYQLATHSGLLVAGEIRSNGTFSQPNSAAVFFAIATVTSLWRYVDDGRDRLDAFFVLIYGAATLSTFSLGGFAGLLAMLVTYGVLRSGSFRLKLGAWALAASLAVAFVATPLGASRIADESSTQLNAASAPGAGSGGSTTSLAWRLRKWESLIPEWKRSPLFGQGLGATVTAEGTSENTAAGKLPHSEYVRYLVETGIIGLAILIWAVVALIRRLNRRRGMPGTHEASTLGIAIVVGLLVNGLAANTLLYTPAAYAAALIVAAVLGASADRGTAPATSRAPGATLDRRSFAR